MTNHISQGIARAALGINLALAAVTMAPVFTSPAMAQTATETTEQSQSAPPINTEQSAPQQSETPPGASDKTTTAFGDWIVNCATIKPPKGDEKNLCEASQTLKQSETGQLVLTYKVQKVNGQMALILITAFGLDISKAAILKANDEVFLEQGFRTCVPRGCIVRADMNEDIEKTMASAETLGVTLFDLTGKPIDIAISPKGLNEALANLNEQ